MNINLIEKIIETNDEKLLKACRDIALVYSVTSNSVSLKNNWDFLRKESIKVPDSVKIFFICTLSMERELQKFVESITGFPFLSIEKELTKACDDYINGHITDKELLYKVKKIKY